MFTTAPKVTSLDSTLPKGRLIIRLDSSGGVRITQAHPSGQRLARIDRRL